MIVIQNPLLIYVAGANELIWGIKILKLEKGLETL